MSGVLLAMSLSAACGKGAGGDTAGSGGDAQSNAEAQDAGSSGILSGGGSEMRVVLTGGPKPGRYEKKSDGPTCTVGYASKGAWGNAATDREDMSGLIGIDLVVPKPDAAKGGTSEFMMIVYIDDPLDPKNQFVIDPPNDKGSGTVTITDRGQTAQVTVRGKSADGVDVDATIDCAQVIRA